MQRDYFITLERLQSGTHKSLSEVLEQLTFDQNGLIPVITQDHATKKVLMFAWMNRQSLSATLTSGRMTYWSRSRNQLWEKGKTSGHTQILISMSFDCDGDAILCLVEQRGGACHTGRESCFYLHVDGQNNRVTIQGDYQDSCQ